MMPWAMVRLDGGRGYKLAPGRFAPGRHFERIAAKRDLEVLDAVAALTDDQAREEFGQIGTVCANERFRGRQAAPVMAPLTCFNPERSMFSDGSFGVLYLQTDAAAAISDACEELRAFLAASGEQPMRLRMGLYAMDLTGEVADLRSMEGLGWEPGVSDPYLASRRLGKRLRDAGISGALYRNPRNRGTDSLAMFGAGTLTRCMRSAIVECSWNGRTIDRVEALPAIEA